MKKLTSNRRPIKKVFFSLVSVAIAVLILATAPRSAQAALVFSDDFSSLSVPAVDGLVADGSTVVNAETTWNITESSTGNDAVYWQPSQDRIVLLTGSDAAAVATVSFDFNVTSGTNYTVTWDTSVNGNTVAQGFTIDLDVTGAAANFTAGIGVGTNTSTTFSATSTGLATFAFTGNTNGGSSAGSDIGLNSVTIDAVTVIPEPNSMILLGLGIGLSIIGLNVRRRRWARS